MLSESELVARLGSEMMRNYLLSIDCRDQWQLIGPVCCPAELMGLSRQLPCSLYAIPSTLTPRVPDAIHPAIQAVNAKYFTTEKNGLGEKRAIWCLHDSGLKHPTLHYVPLRDFREYFPRAESAKSWLDSAWHRNYERIVLIPVAQEVEE